jgi:hypothetical protein
MHLAGAAALSPSPYHAPTLEPVTALLVFLIAKGLHRTLSLDFPEDTKETQI